MRKSPSTTEPSHATLLALSSAALEDLALARIREHLALDIDLDAGELLTLFNRGRRHVDSAAQAFLERIPADCFHWTHPELEPDLDPAAQVKVLIRYYVRTHHSLMRRQQQLKVARTQKYWRFRLSPFIPEQAPARCRAIDGWVERYDSPLWTAHPVPCGRLRCECRIDALSERELRRRRLSIGANPPTA